MNVIVNIKDFDLRNNTYEIVVNLIDELKNNRYSWISIYNSAARSFYNNFTQDIKSITFNKNTIKVEDKNKVCTIKHSEITSFELKK